MVKNTKGGKGHKSLGRKHQTHSNAFLRESTDPLEKYGFVNKMYGNGMCEIICIDNEEQLTLIGHIRNKFRGRQKRSNMVTQYAIVLVGLRDFETIKKNCDLIAIYDENQIKQLKLDPNNKIDLLEKLNPKENINMKSQDNGFEFGYEKDIESYDISNSDVNQTFITDNNEIIDIDDI